MPRVLPMHPIFSPVLGAEVDDDTQRFRPVHAHFPVFRPSCPGPPTYTVQGHRCPRVLPLAVVGWGGRHYDSDTDIVRTFVMKLRRKLGDDAASPAYIVNERGVGYRMARPHERS